MIYRLAKLRPGGGPPWRVGTLALTLLGFLAACTSTQLAGGPSDSPQTLEAGAGVYGSGPQVVGVLAFDETGNLSDGSADSVSRSARLAAETIKGNPLTVVVRTVGADGTNLGPALTDFETLGVKMVIGADNERVAADTAKFMSPKGAPTLALTSFADLAMHLYAAAFVPGEEAVALVNEAARRGYASIAVVNTSAARSQDLAKSILGLAAAAGISARPVDGTTESQFAAAMTAMAAAGVSVEAVVFATGPQTAGAMAATLRDNPQFKSVAIVGNSGWSLLDKPASSLKGAWYTIPQGTRIAEFNEKFKAANGTTGTLNAAMVYDLLVLAAALPQAVKEDPYNPEVLTSPQGFSGFTGIFKFGPTGMAAARNYTLETIE